MKTLEAGDFYGDLHILNDTPTFLTAKSEYDCTFIKMNKKKFIDHFLAKYDQILALDLKVFGNSVLFSHLNFVELALLKSNFVIEKFVEG